MTLYNSTLLRDHSVWYNKDAAKMSACSVYLIHILQQHRQLLLLELAVMINLHQHVIHYIFIG